MTTRWLVAALHLLALGIGLGAVWARARAFHGSLDTAGHVFWAKMALLCLILVFEVVPMMTLIRWRLLVARGEHPDTAKASRLATISYVEAVLIVLMVLAATAMARGYGATGTVSHV